MHTSQEDQVVLLAVILFFVVLSLFTCVLAALMTDLSSDIIYITHHRHSTDNPTDTAESVITIDLMVFVSASFSMYTKLSRPSVWKLDNCNVLK